MGFFDRILGKKPPEPPPPPPEPPPPKRPVFDPEQCLRAVAPVLDAGRVVRRPNDDKIELRGKCGAFPIRVEYDSFGDFTPKLKSKEPVGWIFLENNPDVDASAEPPLDELWDEGDLRIFFDRHIYTEGTHSRRSTRVLATFPDEDRSALFAAMRSEDIRYFRILIDEISVIFRKKASEMSDPERSLRTVIPLMARTAELVTSDKAQTIAAGSDADEEAEGDEAEGDEAEAVDAGWSDDEAEAGKPERTLIAEADLRHEGIVRCRYCRTYFMLDRKCTCLHCGAPYAPDTGG